MNIKMLKKIMTIDSLKELIRIGTRKTASIFNLTPIPIINNILLLIFASIILDLIFNQISNSSFVTAHILSWDTYVYICGVSLYLNGLDPYDYIVLRDCLPDNWNFYFNMPSTVIYLYMPFAKLTNFQWLFIVNAINFYLLLHLFIKIIKKFEIESNFIGFILVYLFLVFNTFDGAITVAIYSGNMGMPIALVGLSLLINYIEKDDKKFLIFIVIVTLLKPIYICFAGAILLKEARFKDFIIRTGCILLAVIILYSILYILDPVNFKGFLANTSHLTNSIDLGFGFISLTKEVFDFFRINYVNTSTLTFFGSTFCILHIFFIYFITRNLKTSSIEKIILISMTTMLFFPRIKVYDSIFIIPIISYLPFYFFSRFNGQPLKVVGNIDIRTYLFRQRIHLLSTLLIVYPLFIYNRWEPFHFIFIIIISLYLFIFALRRKNKEVK